MPVCFQGSSEYQRKFDGNYKEKPHPSWAGMSSIDLANVMEPPLQRKKKPNTDINGGANTTDDYILLGEQGKFAQNVKYKVKKNPLVIKQKLDTTQSQDPPKAPRINKPAPKVVVDTGAPKKKSQKLQMKSVAVETDSFKANGMQNKMKQKKNENDQQYQSAIKPQPSAGVPQPTESQKIINGTSKTQGLNQMDNIAEADNDHQIMQSESKASANYAMAYKAGVAPRRPLSLKRHSEYQSRFQWKDPVGSSPMLAAEQIVYNSNPNMVLAAKDVVPQTTEYRLQFQPWGSDQMTREVDDSAASKAARKARQQKMKRSKSVDAALRVKPAGLPSGLIDNIAKKAEKLKNIKNTQSLHFPHGKQMSHHSEYHNNFRAPAEFIYNDGAWMGANPPHLNQEQAAPIESIKSPAKSWFREVVELREKAMEYRRRARGTHFSREHLAQLYAKQTEMWDTVSSRVESQSSLAALSLETTPRSTHTEPPTTPVHSERKQCWSENSDISLSSKNQQKENSKPLKTSSSLTSSEEGRVPTPKIHHTNVSKKYQRHHLDRTTPAKGGALLTAPPKGQRVIESIPSSQRSEYDSDLTSESTVVNGKPSADIAGQQPRKSLLSKTPEKVECTCGLEEASTSSKNISPRSNTSHHTYTHNSPISPDSTPSKTSTASQTVSRLALNSSPTLGMPTRDSHVLLDEYRSIDEPMQTQYMHTPLIEPPGRREIWKLNHPELSVPSTVLEQTEKSNRDDDMLSVSAMSVASSASLASEVLERAKNRRDEFWST